MATKRKPGLAMLVGAPPKGCKQSTMVLVTRRPRSKWWSVVCFGQKSHYREDGSCQHTDEVIANLNPEFAPRERVRVEDGRKVKAEQDARRASALQGQAEDRRRLMSSTLMPRVVVPADRRVSRDVDPLKHRRVRNGDGREGYIESSHVSSFKGEQRVGGWVHWDDMEKPWHAERVEDLSTLELLDAPNIGLPVYVRKVIFRGRKEQVAEFVAKLGPLDEADAQAGARRFVEFDPQPAAYRRWRVVYQGPPMDPETVAATPDRHPGAERLCKDYRDWSHDDVYPDTYGGY